MSQTGLNILKLWPTETINGPMAQNEDGNTNANGTAFVVDEALMWTFKGEHKFTDKSSLSGLYIYNKTDEPGSTIMKPDKLFMADQDQWFGPLRRRPHVLTLNSTNVLNNTTVLSLRYGFSTWQDSCDAQPFSPGLQSLGFSPTYVNALGPGGKETFPALVFDNTEAVGGWGPGPVRWKGPYAINGALTKLMGSHSFKFGGDARRLGVALATETELGGHFVFDNQFTSKNGTGGQEIASLLLGLPTTGRAPHDPAEFEWFAKYWGAYFQDDWRVSSRFTLNYGLRLEHEDGLREINNRQTVAFDQNAVNPLDAVVPKAGSARREDAEWRPGLRRGQRRAGAAGQSEVDQAGPRVGATFAVDSKTVIRGGYGLFWAPWNYSAERARPDRLLEDDAVQPVGVGERSADRHARQPLSVGPGVADRQSQGLATSVGGQVDFIDQNKGNPKVHQYSADIERELPGAMAISIGYIGATGRDIGYCGTNDGTTATSTSTRSIRRWRGNCFRSAAAGMRRSYASRFPIRSSASPQLASSAPERRLLAASCSDRSLNSATS